MNGVYFYCAPPSVGDEVLYQHLLVCLAEGLTALGVPCYSNIDCWPLDPDRSRYVLRHDPNVTADDCAVVILSDEWFTRGGEFPERSPISNACWIALDREDGSRLRTLQPGFRSFDFVLRTHFSRHTQYRSNFVPWAYGLSERIIAATADATPEGRTWELVANWRHTRNPHSLRLAVERSFLPRVRAVLPIDDAREALDTPPAGSLDYLWWYETGRRHWPAYYERMKAAAACASFGGYFVTPWPAAKESFLSRLIKRGLTRTHLETHLISQWDSWRFWEAFASGCANINVDLARYDCVLPVMPVNGEHYIGVDLDDVTPVIERLRDDPASVARIGAAGRTWALEHYGPVATARRMLDLAGIVLPSPALAAQAVTEAACTPAE
jgi:hypothetical protein